MKKAKNKINWNITADEVRLIDENGTMCGIISKDTAVKRALSLGIDLVEISGTSPPVCKIINYGKYIYTIEKKISSDKKKQKVVVLKEIKFRPNICTHDYETKMRNASDFLSGGYKVRFSLRFIGREILHPEVGMDLMNRAHKKIESLCKVEFGPKIDGNVVSMVVSPL